MSVNKRRKTSELWSFFTPSNDENIASCNMCKCKFSYKSTTSNLRKHVEAKHPTVSLPPSTKLLKTNQPFEEPAQTSGAGEQLEAGIFDGEVPVDVPAVEVPDRSDGEVPGRSTAVVKKRSRQEKMSSFIPKKVTAQGKKYIDNKLMKLFTKHFHSFRIVEEEGFIELVEALNPNYQLPSRHMISKTAIPSLYEECLHNTKMIVQSGKTFCVTTDCWTSRNTTSYIAVTAHFVNEKFELLSLLLECSAMSSQHTSKNLADEISRILSEWGISDKILLSVSDNASNIQGALKNLLGLKNFGCFAHTLNLLVNDALNVTQVNDLLHKVKTIVSHFRKSCVANEKLMACQRNMGTTSTPLKLVQDVCTRWNSTFYMVERFTMLEAPIRSTVALLDKELPVLSSDEWKTANQLCKILKPFESVTSTISGEQYCTASLVIPLVNGLESVLTKMSQKDYLPPVKEVVINLKNGLKKRCGSYENSQTLLVSTFLDPRFKNLAFSEASSAENAKKYVSNALVQRFNSMMGSTECEPIQEEKETDEDDEFKVWSSYEKTISETKPRGTPLSRAIVEIQRYLDEDVPERKSNPLEWWKKNAAMYPHLSEIAKEKLCTLATSVPCERMFSKAGLLVTDRRNRLSENKTKMLLFLSSNSNLGK